MEDRIKGLVEEIKDVFKETIEKRLANPGDADDMWDAHADLYFFEKVLRVYNRWCETENDGQEYIFDIRSTDDVICCMKAGLTMEDASRIYEDSKVSASPFFFFGHSYTKPCVFGTWKEVAGFLCATADEYLLHFLESVYVFDEYHALWQDVISDYIDNFWI